MIQYEQFASKIFQRVISIPSDIAFYFSNKSMLEKLYFYPKYQSFLQESVSNSPHMSSLEESIVRQIQQQGIAIIDLESLNIDRTESFWHAAQSVAQKLREMSQFSRYAGKHTLTATAKQLLEQPNILWWGYSAKLLRIAAGYLELPIAYDGLSFYYSVANGKEQGPRKWHRDKEDWKMVKICVYLHDVDLDGGPLECVLPPFNTQLRQLSQPYQVLPSSKINKLLGSKEDDWYKSCVAILLV